jgi:predicted enzyme related to lactoylglutathione lyase
MPLKRRKLLQAIPFAIGTTLLGNHSQTADAQTPASASPFTKDIEKVTGIGGFFFRAQDHKALGLWYEQHLGIPTMPMKADDPIWHQDAGETVFATFSETTKYFDVGKPFMVNFRVRDLDKIAAQLTAAGIDIKVDPTTYPNGKFAHLHDPEGNPIELWQPMGTSAKS